MMFAFCKRTPKPPVESAANPSHVGPSRAGSAGSPDFPRSKENPANGSRPMTTLRLLRQEALVLFAILAALAAALAA
jgi:hypothetical protein